MADEFRNGEPRGESRNHDTRHDRGLKERLEGVLPDILRRTIASGVGGLTMTEETIRTLVKDLSLPKDVLTFLISQSEKTREEVVRIVAQEIRSYLERSNAVEEVKKALSTMTIELKTEIRFRPDEQSDALVPETKTTAEVAPSRPSRRRRS